MVPRVGVEPTRASPPDFESSVSTNSTIEASYIRDVGWNFTQCNLKACLKKMRSITYLHNNTAFSIVSLIVSTID